MVTTAFMHFYYLYHVYLFLNKMVFHDTLTGHTVGKAPTCVLFKPPK